MTPPAETPQEGAGQQGAGQQPPAQDAGVQNPPKDDAGTGTGTATETPPKQDTPPASGQEPTSGTGGQQGLSDEATRAELKRARDEAAKYRTERKQLGDQLEGFKDAIAKALGLKEDEQDAEQVSGQLTEMTGKYREERIKNAFYVEAFHQGADVELAWAHLFASGVLNDIDVDDESYRQEVATRLEAALEKYPKLKADFAPSAQDEQQRNVGSGSNPPGGGDSHPEDELFKRNPYTREHRNLTKQAQIEKDNPGLAKRLQDAAGAKF